MKGELTGVIYVDNRIHAGVFTEAERELLTAFANHAGVALQNARLFESVRRTLAEVTELKNLMGNVLASIASGVITADINHRISLCNRAAQNILGQFNQSMVGQTSGGRACAHQRLFRRERDLSRNRDGPENRPARRRSRIHPELPDAAGRSP